MAKLKGRDGRPQAAGSFSDDEVFERIHDAIVDALGNPLAVSLTGGQVHDIKQAEALVAQVGPQSLLADKAYDSDALIES